MAVLHSDLQNPWFPWVKLIYLIPRRKGAYKGLLHPVLGLIVLFWNSKVMFFRRNIVNPDILAIILLSRIALKDISYVNPEIFSIISVKRHVCDAKNSRLGHDLHISVNNRVISAFHEDFIFTKLCIWYAKFCENKTLAKICEFTLGKQSLSILSDL